jgi:MFS family permease
MIVAFVPMVTAFSGIQQNLGPFARDAGIGDQQTAYLISIFSGVMIGGKIFFGAMADRFDQRLLYWLAVTTLAMSMWLMMTGPDFARLVLIVTLLGFAAGAMVHMVLVELLPEAFNQGRRAAVATVTTVSIVAMVLFQRLL